jgi:LuxR family maltose regulon positive regulatory protein
MRGALKTHLTSRESEIVNCLKRGLSNNGIAEALGIKVGTVKVHLRSAFSKLGCRSRLEAATLHEQARPRAS